MVPILKLIGGCNASAEKWTDFKDIFDEKAEIWGLYNTSDRKVFWIPGDCGSTITDPGSENWVRCLLTPIYEKCVKVADFAGIMGCSPIENIFWFPAAHNTSKRIVRPFSNQCVCWRAMTHKYRKNNHVREIRTVPIRTIFWILQD